MPVYNADGTLNADGSIEGFIKVRMVIGDHAEQIELAVTNLGMTDVFLGLDWLCFHNPTINWTMSEMTFDWCPSKCGYIPWWYAPEEDFSSNQLEKDDQLLIFDWEGYIHNHGHIRAITTPSASEKYIKEFPSVFNKQGFDKLPK